jgi:hypothetical protein
MSARTSKRLADAGPESNVSPARKRAKISDIPVADTHADRSTIPGKATRLEDAQEPADAADSAAATEAAAPSTVLCDFINAVSTPTRDDLSGSTSETDKRTAGIAGERWTEKQDNALRSAVADHGGKNWKGIAEKVPGRNSVQCRQRWMATLRPGIKNGRWTIEEDQLLLMMKRLKATWHTCANAIHGRTSRQCRERWNMHLNPAIKKGNWTANEDQTILTMHAKVGNKWKIIAALLPGRTNNDTKIRFLTLKRKQRSKAKESAPAKDRVDKARVKDAAAKTRK